MKKILKNNTLTPITIRDVGVEIPTLPSVFIIHTQDYELWSASNDLITYIVSEDVTVNDGEDDLLPRIGAALIQDNQIVLNQHYTLVQTDDILVGNGEILYLNDDHWTTTNAPEDDVEQIEYLDDNLDPENF